MTSPRQSTNQMTSPRLTTNRMTSPIEVANRNRRWGQDFRSYLRESPEANTTKMLKKLEQLSQSKIKKANRWNMLQKPDK